MNGKFCPKCGATDKQFHGSFCIDCYLTDHPDLVKLEDATIKQCPRCLRLLSKGEWQSGKSDSLESIIAGKLKTSLESPVIELEPLEKNTKRETYLAQVTGMLDGKPVTVSREVAVKYVKDTCDVCSRKSGDYFVATIQLRPKGREIDLDRMKSAVNFFRNETRALVKKDRNAEIFRFEESKNGVDLLFGSMRVAKLALQHFQSTYHPTVKESYTLTGVHRSTGKNKYRVTYSVRI